MKAFTLAGTTGFLLVLAVYTANWWGEYSASPAPIVSQNNGTSTAVADISKTQAQDGGDTVLNSVEQSLGAPDMAPEAQVSEEQTEISVQSGEDLRYKGGIATVFWVGEAASDENDYIANDESAWDVNWEEHFGGLDDPEDRCGFLPCAFVPLENPFYVALPYSDFYDDGIRKKSASAIPWYEETEINDDESLLKNRWVEVTYRDRNCFAQVEDVGPFVSDDFAYVFGEASAPKNTFGEAAGIDVSPAMRDCLKMRRRNAEVEWRLVSPGEVPDGPWKEIITTSQVGW
jgi:hypothetical protein